MAEIHQYVWRWRAIIHPRSYTNHLFHEYKFYDNIDLKCFPPDRREFLLSLISCLCFDSLTCGRVKAQTETTNGVKHNTGFYNKETPQGKGFSFDIISKHNLLGNKSMATLLIVAEKSLQISCVSRSHTSGSTSVHNLKSPLVCFTAGISSFAIQPTPIVVTEGSVARFSCKISAHPPPIITWELNRVTLPLATERYALFR